MEATITAMEMRKKMGKTLDRVCKQGEHITITRGNLQLATLIPAPEHEVWCHREVRAIRMQQVFKEIEEWQERNKEVLKKMGPTDSVKEIRKMRDTRWSSSTHR